MDKKSNLKNMCIDICRYINIYLLVEEALNMEIALAETFHDKQHYIHRIKYEPCSLNIGLYRMLCKWDTNRFKIIIHYNQKCQMTIFNYLSITSREALLKTNRLFRLH